MRVIGLMSGTSYDAIDVAAAEFHADGDTLRLRPLGELRVEYRPDLRDAIAAVLPPAPTSIEAVCALTTGLGHAYAVAAVRGLGELCDGAADLVVSHGQTVYHWVRDGQALGTLQLGQPAFLAAATGLPVLSDVRAADLAAGGQGAPLVPVFDALLLAPEPGSRLRRAALNLGGIANITVLSGAAENAGHTADGAAPHRAAAPHRTAAPDRTDTPGVRMSGGGAAGGSADMTADTPRGAAGRRMAGVLGYDTGPANALLDLACQRYFEVPYDEGGRRAAAGRVLPDLLAALLAEPYYAADPPKSTGRELFHRGYLDGFLVGRDDAPADLLATLTELTARTVADQLRRHGIEEVVGAGGGMRNPLLVDRIATLAGCPLRPIDGYGIPADAKEAYAFALLGWLSWHGLPGALPSVTGARHAAVLGALTPGAGPLRLPHPATMPHRLRVVGAA